MPDVRLRERLCRSQGKEAPDTESFPVSEVVKKLGIRDAVWCLRGCYYSDRDMSSFVDFLESRVSNPYRGVNPLTAHALCDMLTTRAWLDTEGDGAAKDQASKAAWGEIELEFNKLFCE